MLMPTENVPPDAAVTPLVSRFGVAGLESIAIPCAPGAIAVDSGGAVAQPGALLLKTQGVVCAPGGVVGAAAWPATAVAAAAACVATAGGTAWPLAVTTVPFANGVSSPASVASACTVEA